MTEKPTREYGELSSILLHPFLPELVASLKRHGDLVLDPQVEAQVLTASRSTVERLLAPVWGKGQDRVGGGVHRARMRLPFAVTSIHSDNGSEFINHPFAEYCQRQTITFTRSRPYRKNDSAHTEQKNGALVRRLIGSQASNLSATISRM